MRKISIFVLFTLLSFVGFSVKIRGHIFPLSREESQAHMANAIYQIIQEFPSSLRTVDVTAEIIDRKSNLVLSVLIENVHSKNDISKAFCLQDSTMLTSYHLRTYNVFIVDSNESFLRIYDTMNETVYAYRGYYIIAITNVFSDPFTVVQKMFEKLWKIFVVNVIALIRYNSRNTIDMYTYYPFTETHCRKIVPVVYNSFEHRTFTRSGIFFPRKLKNFHGCPLNAVVWDSMPYLSLNTLENGTVQVSGGIDGKILAMLSKALNFSSSYLVPEDDPARGVILKNGTTTGALNLVIEGDGDFTICGFGYTYERIMLMTPSIIYLNTDMIFASPAPPPYTPLERLFLPFTFHVWILILASLVAGLLVIVVLKTLGRKYIEFVSGRGNRSVTFQMFNVYLGGVVTKGPGRNFARTALCLWLIKSLILRNSYQGSMFKYLQSSEVKRIDKSVKELIKDGYVVYILNHQPNVVEIMDLGEEEYIFMDTNVTKYYEKLHQPGFKGLIVDTNFDLMYHNTLNLTRPIIYPLSKRLYNFPASIYYKKNSFLTEPFDIVLWDFIGSGLIKKWVLETLSRPYEQRDTHSGELKSISLTDLKGCLQICGLFTIISICVFLLELLTLKSYILRKIINALNY